MPEEGLDEMDEYDWRVLDKDQIQRRKKGQQRAKVAKTVVWVPRSVPWFEINADVVSNFANGCIRSRMLREVKHEERRIVEEEAEWRA